MKFLFISATGDFLPVAKRVKEEGNSVAIWIKSARAKEIELYRGLLSEDEMPATLSKALDRFDYEPDAVIFDHVGQGDLADELRAHGLPVFNGSKIQDRLEDDRYFGLQVMQRAHIKIPITSPRLQSIADARQFMNAHKDIDRWVVKFLGETTSPRSTAIGTPEEIIDELDTLLGEGEGSKFIIQQFVEGVEVSTEIWVCNGNIVYPANATLETKRYLAGDIGINTGCMTSIVWVYEEAEQQIVEEGIGKLAEQLKEWNYNGTLDLNSIVNDDGVFGLEWTPRFGYNAIFALFELFDDEISRILHDAANGELEEIPCRFNEAAYAIRLYTPPAPFTDYLTGDIYERLKDLSEKGEDIKALAEALAKVGIDVSFERGTGNLKSVDLKEVGAGTLVTIPERAPATIWLLDVKERYGKLVTAGMDGIICEVSAARPRLSDAVKACEETVREIHLPGKCWRCDGHLRAFDAAKLAAMGYEVPESVLR